ncbi:MAG: FapA family protein, partial [Lachnospiraceae bacterium]|nr:FapA family protein [Lachnospiraceae bacterium]
MNGYFQIVSRDNMCAVKMIPPTAGGEPIRREELMEYLTAKGISFDPKVLVSMLSEHSTVVYMPTTTPFRFSEGEVVKISVSPDNMLVTVRMMAPYEGSSQMTKEEFMREFSSRGICFGFNDEAINEFLDKRPYCTDFEAAHGKPPRHGNDASIEYFFNTDPRVKPTLLEDGSVDFFHLNTINHCQKGDLLAKLTPADFGDAGTNVKGEKIRPRDVKTLQLHFGHNIELSADKTEIRSMVNGHVTYADGKVFVSNVLEVANVDNAVGNIDYDGSVTVTGNVCENFEVKAKGSVEVRGVVEGARIEAGENIIIARGMNGMHKGELIAGGNVISKFIENARVTAKGYVESESILHSEVVAGTEIKVTGKRGFIAGGRTCATSVIEVKNLGSAMGADTVVEVGMDTTVKRAIQELQKEVTALSKSLAQINPVLDGARTKLQNGIKMSTEQLLQIQKLAKLSKEQHERLDFCNGELEKYQITTASTNTGTVIVTGEVYPGT